MFPMNGRNSFAVLSCDTQVGTARTSIIEHAGTHPLRSSPDHRLLGLYAPKLDADCFDVGKQSIAREFEARN
jgi:hypothetical protein